MTRLKTFICTALGLVLALAVLGAFAGVGLAILGALVVLGLSATLAAWIATAFEPKPACSKV
ncbi:MAG: hypothetical protein QNI90_06155 [Dinoroseobacter sp.]|nr:hypothetical protein [Dinoroseobacter sp.]MDJ0993136.1 hypothetical protein [Dinoroseobacter sp.]